METDVFQYNGSVQKDHKKKTFLKINDHVVSKLEHTAFKQNCFKQSCLVN